MTTLTANIIASPFNGSLAETTQAVLTNLPIENLPLWRSIGASIKRQLRILRYYLPIILGCLFLFIIPFVHVIASILWFTVSAWFIALQYLDYPAENNGMQFDALIKLSKQNRSSTFIFGLIVLGLFAIPVINLFAMPISVIAATLYYLDLQS